MVRSSRNWSYDYTLGWERIKALCPDTAKLGLIIQNNGVVGVCRDLKHHHNECGGGSVIIRGRREDELTRSIRQVNDSLGLHERCSRTMKPKLCTVSKCAIDLLSRILPCWICELQYSTFSTTFNSFVHWAPHGFISSGYLGTCAKKYSFVN